MANEKCPVCGWDMKDGGIKVRVAGKEITVCCDECVAKVKDAPGAYSGQG